MLRIVPLPSAMGRKRGAGVPPFRDEGKKRPARPATGTRGWTTLFAFVSCSKASSLCSEEPSGPVPSSEGFEVARRRPPSRASPSVGAASGMGGLLRSGLLVPIARPPAEAFSPHRAQAGRRHPPPSAAPDASQRTIRDRLFGRRELIRSRMTSRRPPASGANPSADSSPCIGALADSGRGSS
jgi:hypothetical protein